MSKVIIQDKHFERMMEDFKRMPEDVRKRLSFYYLHNIHKELVRPYMEALEKIATGSISGEENNYRDTVAIMRGIAKDVLRLPPESRDERCDECGYVGSPNSWSYYEDATICPKCLRDNPPSKIKPTEQGE